MSMRRSLILAAAGGVFCFAATGTEAAISYNTPGQLYSEGFDGLPTDAPAGANIQNPVATPYVVNGWQDDTTTVAGDHVSVPGWYLYHPTDVGLPNPPANSNEGGTNAHQRFRFGPGANTGSFWAFGTTAASAEKALGSVQSTTTAGNGLLFYQALRLTNNTGQTLTSFTLTFDGEEWRDGQSATGETLLFDYSLDATTANWFSQPTVTPPPTFTAVPTLNFTSPVFAGTGSSGTAVDGNGVGKVADISATVAVNWAPGTDLWLRWGDPQLASNADDGLAVDNVRFTAEAAVPEPGVFSLVGMCAMGLLGRRRTR